MSRRPSTTSGVKRSGAAAGRQATAGEVPSDLPAGTAVWIKPGLGNGRRLAGIVRCTRQGPPLIVEVWTVNGLRCVPWSRINLRNA